MSERFHNLHGTFTKCRGQATADFIHMKPVASHALQITDFCTWARTAVLAGVRATRPDGHVFGDGQAKLWFGAVDDLETGAAALAAPGTRRPFGPTNQAIPI